MRIISNFKDYYDWVVFETDNRKIYNRTTQEVMFRRDHYKSLSKNEIFFDIDFHSMPINEYIIYQTHTMSGMHLILLHVCNNIYVGFDNSFHKNYNGYDFPAWEFSKIHADDVKTLERDKKKHPWYYERSMWNKRRWDGKTLGLLMDGNKTNPQPMQSKVNKIFNCPIVLQKQNRFTINPSLSDLGFKLVAPERMYQDIYNFIEYKEPIMPNNPNDMARYEAKGFDKKSSFRPKIKK